MLHFGRKHSDSLDMHLDFGKSGYGLTLKPTADNRLVFAKEALFRNGKVIKSFHSGSYKSGFDPANDDLNRLLPPFSSSRVYHFHDTGGTALLKQQRGINDNEYLHPDASNLAAFLYRLGKRHKKHYNQIHEASA